MFIKMNDGWISLHRKIRDNALWKNSQLVHLFLELLLTANHEEKKIVFNGKIEVVGRGQLITGRYTLSEATGIKPSSIRNYLQLLKNLEILDIKPNNKFSLITILKYNQYQGVLRKKDIKQDNNLTSTGQQKDTNNNDNNEKNIINKKLVASPQTFPKKDYEEIEQAYQTIKGVEPQKNEWLPIQAEIKRMFLNGRSVEQIKEAIEVCNDLYDDWSMATIRMKIADVVSGKLKPKTFKNSGIIPLGVKQL
jgi:hypothetical protein